MATDNVRNEYEVQKVETRIDVRGPYDPDFIMTFKTIPGHKWNGARKTWEFPYTDSTYNFLKNLLEAKPLKEQLDSVKQARAPIIEFGWKFLSPKGPAFQHQLETFSRFADKKFGAIFLDMGLGKTLVVANLIAYHLRRGNIKRCLYIAPNSTLENVYREMTDIGLPSVVLQGQADKRRVLLEQEAVVYIINYEGLAVIFGELLRKNFDMVVCDESTLIKNAKAFRSRAAVSLGRAASIRFIMTGEPVPESAMDVFGQYLFLTPKIFGLSEIAHRMHYCETRPYQIPFARGGREFVHTIQKIVGHKNVDELREKMYSCAIRFTKDQCLDLPKKLYQILYYDLDKESAKLYKEITEQVLVEFKKGFVGTQGAMLKLVRHRQILSGFINDEQGHRQWLKKNPKLELFEEVMDSVKGKKVLVLCVFRAEIESVGKLLEKKGITYLPFHGDIHQRYRQEIIDSFNDPDGCQVFLGQIRATAFGLNLQEANAETVVYYGHSFENELRNQSEDRVHRIGTVDNVTYISLVGRHTIEESIMKALQTKRDFGKLIHGITLRNCLMGKLV